MGTSRDFTGGKGGDWTPLKQAASRYAREIGQQPANRRGAKSVLRRHVPVLGGAAAAAASAHRGRSGTQSLASLLSGIATDGLAATLDDLGLAEYIGRDRFDVLDALITLVAEDGADVEGQAARDAACDVLDQLFEDAETWDQLDEVVLSGDELVHLLEVFLASYVYNRVPVIAERLARLVDPEAARRADSEMREIVENLLVINLPRDPLAIQWDGDEGRRIIDDAVRDVYEAIETLGES